MRFDVYCDESYPDLFSSANPKGRYMVIGGLWLSTENRGEFKKEIHALRDKHLMGKGEFKWNKVSGSRYSFYTELLDWFMSKGDDLRFRCIVVDNDKIDLVKFHNDDQELGFFKFYYQMIHHWILDFNEYNIFCDYKSLNLKSRYEVLGSCLTNANRFSLIQKVQAVHSHESVLLQLNDVLLGIASAKFNDSVSSGSHKGELIAFIEKKLGRSISPTSNAEKKYNVFKINLQGGW
ncbi:MAG: DUF3800 domain-containing protein [Candidatus Cloacimonetes bacterium]|nr:DUF3800 domain-containing protein [Candidatus Cloacimonadota bacterium]